MSDPDRSGEEALDPAREPACELMRDDRPDREFLRLRGRLGLRESGGVSCGEEVWDEGIRSSPREASNSESSHEVS
jgi:hypothetical protein